MKRLKTDLSWRHISFVIIIFLGVITSDGHISIHGKQWLGIISIMMLVGYGSYLCGWINGHLTDRRK
jgi:hypothetical protein